MLQHNIAWPYDARIFAWEPALTLLFSAASGRTGYVDASIKPVQKPIHRAVIPAQAGIQGWLEKLRFPPARE